MKRFLPLILAALPLCATADDGGFATAAEFGAPRPELTTPKPELSTPLRQWMVRGERPFRAQLTGISGRWGKNATVSLRTPTGRMLNIPASRLSDADLQAIRDYMQAEGFVQRHTYRYGTLDVKLLSVRPHSKEELQLVLQDLSGRVHYMRANTEPWQEEYARKVQFNDPIVMQEETRLMLLDFMSKNPPHPPAQNAPLPIAESAMEALTYAALRDVSVVVLTMGPRGCRADVDFRRYLREHPEAADIWAQRHVFLIAYTDATGTLPADCCRELAELGYHHDRRANAGDSVPAGSSQLRQHCESICGIQYTLLSSNITDKKQQAAPKHNRFSIKLEDLHKSQPQHINFNR